LALPGGDRAAREPWRMGMAMLARLGRLDDAPRLFASTPGALRLADAIRRGARFAGTSSLGRLFDAAAALAGVCLVQHYEGQAAMEFEALVETPRRVAGGWFVVDGRLDLGPAMATMLDERLAGREAAEAFHGTLTAGLAEWIGAEARRRGLTRVALGGGCLMNRVLAEGLVAALRADGLDPALPREVPANDGGVSFGQAAFARSWALAGGGWREE
jgi:hydrogenase maturation protein HypF